MSNRFRDPQSRQVLTDQGPPWHLIQSCQRARSLPDLLPIAAWLAEIWIHLARGACKNSHSLDRAIRLLEFMHKA